MPALSRALEIPATRVVAEVPRAVISIDTEAPEEAEVAARQFFEALASGRELEH